MMDSTTSAPVSRTCCAWSWRESVLLTSAIALFGIAALYLVLFGTAVALQDDLTQLYGADASQPLDLASLWMQHNEHRVPLPRFVFLELLRWTRDFRTTTVLDLGLLAGAAAVLVCAARRARGASRVTDVFLPLVLLSLAQYDNFLNGFQICFVLPVVSTCVLIALFGTLRGPPNSRHVTAVGVLALISILCGSFGLVVAAFSTAWLVWIALSPSDASSDPATPSWRAATSKARILAACFVVASCTLVVAYLRGLHVVHGLQTRDMTSIVRVAGQMLASWTGGLAASAWPASGIVAAALLLVGCAWPLLRARRDVANRSAWLGLAAMSFAIVVVALAIGRGRGAGSENPGFASRYASLALVAPVALYIAACRARDSSIARTLQVVLCFLALAGWITSIGPALHYGENRIQLALSLERAAHEEMAESEIAAKYARMCFTEREGFDVALAELDRLGLPPFWRASVGDRLRLLGRDPATGESVMPVNVSGSRAPEWEQVGRFEGLAVAPGGELSWPLPQRAFILRGRYCIPNGSAHGAARFVVEVRAYDGSVVDKREFVVDPSRGSSDIGTGSSETKSALWLDFALRIEERHDTTLVLRFDCVDIGAERVHGLWGDVRLR